MARGCGGRGCGPPLRLLVLLLVIVISLRVITDLTSPALLPDCGGGHAGSSRRGQQGVPAHRETPVLSSGHDTDYSVIGKAEAADNSTYWSAQSQLVEGSVPLDVYYFWCGRRWFEFKHYLSMLSAIKAIRPDKIYFYIEMTVPVMDRSLYNQWYYDLRKEYPFIVERKLTTEQAVKVCKDLREEQVQFLLSVLNVAGGIYVSENTWLVELAPEQRTRSLEMALTPNGKDGYIIMQQGVLDSGMHYKEILKDPKRNVRKTDCSAMRHVMIGARAQCVLALGAKIDGLKPLHVWELDDPLGRLVRNIYYGTEDILKPEPSYDTLVPNIGHMVWNGGGRMDYVFYLSVLSMLYVARVDVVYIHGDKPPTGEYWAELCSIPRIRERIKLIRRTPPEWVYLGEIPPFQRALMSDIIRVDLMIKFGGIYTDTDAIWTKPLLMSDRGFDAVATYDWIDWTLPFPDTVNFGVSYGKRNAPFWRLFRETMRELHNDHPGYTGVHQPYKVLEKHPELLRIDRRLSVICYQLRCHPLWVPDYHNATNNHVTTGSIRDWRSDVHAFHWTHPNPPEFSNRTALMQGSGMFAEIGRNVLQQAGLL